ncbi:hypothetical protein LINPERHAP2_LOCUS7855, partial [Linum perenne]
RGRPCITITRVTTALTLFDSKLTQILENNFNLSNLFAETGSIGSTSESSVHLSRLARESGFWNWNWNRV